MWDGLLVLLGLSSLMAIASFLAGSLPLSFSLSQRQLRLISAIGTGVLVGTSLIVIIPEGVNTLYTAKSATAAVEAIQEVEAPIRGGVGALGLHGLPSHDSVSRSSPIDQLAGPLLARADVADHIAAIVETRTDHGNDHEHEQEPAHHAWIGISLIAGFILMYLIDNLSIITPKPIRAPHSISLHDLHHSSSSSTSPGATAHLHSTTIGLVIHATADGIALGASSANPATRTTLGLVVFAAIMLHKAPAAFGLTAVLLKQGLSKRMARTHLIVFSLAAPAGAIGTWVLLSFLGGFGTADHTWWTGIVLLFSGGTFLYVAMHSMVRQSPGHGHGGVGGEYGEEGEGMLDSFGGGAGGQAQKSEPLDVILMVLGMLLPLLTQIGHTHAHGG